MAYTPKETPQKITKRRKQGKWIGRLLKLIGFTLRYKLIDPYHVFKALPHPHIYIFWHNRLACATLWYRHLVKLPQRAAAMISASGDGETLTAAMNEFDIDAIRGSTSRGGQAALQGALKALENGKDVSITPDGPRGPKYILQPGVIALAKLSGKPIIPTRFELSLKWELKTWDHFQVPLPFARCTLTVQKPHTVSENDDFNEIQKWLTKELGD